MASTHEAAGQLPVDPSPSAPIEERRGSLLIDATWRKNRHKHIPGEDGWPLFGKTVQFLRNQSTWSQSMYERYGPVFRSNAFFRRSVSVASPEAAYMLLRDKERNFSSELGWDGMIGRFFARGLMLRDFDDHRKHRRVMQEAFKKPALRAYLDMMSPLIEDQIRDWPTGREFRFYPTIKQLTLDLAGVVFTGMPPGPELARANQAFIDTMQALFAVNRLPLLGRKWARGKAARTYLAELFQRLIPAKRDGEDPDLLAWLCRAESDTGERLSDDEIVDHMVFLMLAAHDTTTSALTNIVWSIGAHPEWQERLRAQILELDRDHLSWDDLDQLGDVDLVLKEALRLYPPVTSIPRLVLRECEIEGHRIPQWTVLWLQVSLIHRLPELWTDPDRFDPERFSDERAEHKRHPGQFIPYSSGAHICLGMTFSIVQVKAVLNQLLKRYRIQLREGYAPKRQVVPFPKPIDDVPVTLERI